MDNGLPILQNLSGLAMPMLHAPRAGDYAALATWVTDAMACARWAGPLIRFPLDAATLPAALAIGDNTSYFLAKETALAFGQHRVIEAGGVHLGRIIVAPAMRGTGLGRVLVEQLITKALAATSAGHVTLRVYRDNPQALALYRGFGFEMIDEKSDHAVYFMRVDTASLRIRAEKTA